MYFTLNMSFTRRVVVIYKANEKLNAVQRNTLTISDGMF